MDRPNRERFSWSRTVLAMHLPARMRDVLKRYGLALALACLALLIRGALPFPEGSAIYQLPIAAVIVSAWYGGRGPGLLASLICIAGSSYWFVPPVNSFTTSPDHTLPFSIFVVLCLFLTEFGAGRRRAEYSRRASEERFRTLVQFSFDVYWETDAEHRFTRQEFSERLTDAPARGAELGKTRWEIPYVEPDEEAWRKHRATMDAHLPFRDFELARPTADGGKRYVSVSGMPVFDSAGRFVGYRGVGRHITEHKRVEAELRARQQMLDLAQKAARAVAFDWYIGARESENRWAPELEAMYGLEPGTFDRTFQGWKKLVHPDDWPGVKVAIQRAHETGDIAAEYRVVHSDGSVHWLRARGRMFFSADGQPERMVGFMIDITDLRQAEEEHRAYLRFLESMDRINRAIQGTDELERMMSEVLEATLEIFACDRAWIIYPCDPRASSWRALMEHTRPEFPGAFALKEELPIDAEIAAVFEAAQTAPGPVMFGSDYDLKVPSWAAERFTIRSQMAMAIDTKGDKRHLFGLHQCSHARLWTGEEQALFQEIGRRLGDAIGALSMIRSVRESERRLDAAQRVAHVGWWERDFVMNRVSLSEEAQRIFGVQPVNLPQWQDRWANLIHPYDRLRAAEAAAAAMRGGPRYDVEYRVIRPDGAVRVVHSQGDVAFDESGQPLRQFGVMQDITELRRAEDELSEIRERFRVLAESSLTGIYLTENDRFSYVNPALAKMFGYQVEEIVGRNSMDLTCPDDQPLVAENMRRRLEGEIDEIRYEFRGLRKDGSVFPVEVHGRRIEHGGKIGVLGTLVDNTERKRAEDELRASEARFRTFVDHATDAFFLHDDRLVIVDVNRQACDSLGYSREELIGMHPRDFDVGLDEPSLARLAQRVGAGEAVTFETLHRRKDGIVFPVEIRARMFQQADKNFRISLARDISDRKLTEETLRGKEDALQMARAELTRVSRVMTMGELTASIAHEVNQPLGAMVANAAACTRWLAAEPPEIAKTRRVLESIAADGRRASEVIGRIRALVKRQAPQKALLDVNQKIRDVLALSEHELRSHHIVLETRLAEGLPVVAGDRVQLQQVFLNLIVNAIEAMSTVRDRTLRLTIVSQADGPDGVMVEVRDSGTGLDAERTEDLFDAFYTTKSEGIGIGLSISRSIVEAHGGHLSAQPNTPHGAVFRISLPAAGPGLAYRP
jgi:PAS domain S-box-containing protein